MRGYWLTAEAVLSAFLVFLLLVVLFLPLPTTYSVTRYVEQNDRIIAQLESCFSSGDCVSSVSASECVDYRHVLTRTGELRQVCVPP